MMIEGEATQDPNAPAGASEPPLPEEQATVAAQETPAEPESAAEPETPAEPASAAEPEISPAPSLNWSHLAGFQAAEPPPEELSARPDYAEEFKKELGVRAARFVQSVDESIVLSSDGVMRWLGDPIARVVGGDALLTPRPVLLADEALAGEERAAVQTRAGLWLAAHVRKVLGPLTALAEGTDLTEAARTLGAKIAEALGVLDRERVKNEVRSLDQTARGALRKVGVRFGSLYIYVPILLKPGARALSTLLWTLRRGTETGADRLLAFASAGRTSFANEGLLSPDAYRVAGFRLCGERVVRVDIIERLSDLIRAAIPDHMRSGSRPNSEAYGFLISPQMTSLTGCSGEAFASILRSLGFEPVQISKAAFEAANRKAPMEPIKPASDTATAEEAPAEISDAAEVAETSPTESAQPVEDVTADAETDSREDTPPVAETSPAEELSAESAVAEDAEVFVEDAAAEVADRADSDAESLSQAEADDAGPVAAEAAADAAAIAESEPPAVSPEADQIEIWRPAPRRPRAPQRPREAEREARPPQQGRPDRRRGRAQEPARPAETVVAAEPTPEPAARPPRREDGPRRFEGKAREERRPKDFAPRRESRPTQVDPDSPFAKLAALKPLLERRDKRP